MKFYTPTDGYVPCQKSLETLTSARSRETMGFFGRSGNFSLGGNGNFSAGCDFLVDPEEDAFFGTVLH